MMDPEPARVQAALDAALWALRTMAQDLERCVWSAQTCRLIAQDTLAECQRLLDGREREEIDDG